MNKEDILEIETEIIEEGNANVATVGDESVIEILVQPSSQYVNVDDVFVFNVVARGENLAYKWEFSNDYGVTWKEALSMGFDTSCIMLTAKDVHNGRLYRCVISDSSGYSVISDVAQINIGAVSEEMLFELMSDNTQLINNVYNDVHLIMVLALLTFVTSCLRGWRKNVTKGGR